MKWKSHQKWSYWNPTNGCVWFAITLASRATCGTTWRVNIVCRECTRVNIVGKLWRVSTHIEATFTNNIKRTQLDVENLASYFLPKTLFDLVKAGLPPELVFKLVSFLFFINFSVEALWILVHSWNPCSGKLLTKPPPTASFLPPLPLPWLQVVLFSDWREGDDKDLLRDKASHPSSILFFVLLASFFSLVQLQF